MIDPNDSTKSASQTGTWRQEFRRGVKAAFPLLLGVAPFGMIVGVSATGAGLSTLEASAMSIMVFAGASQLAALELIGAGAAAPIVWLTAALINARFLMYSASLAPHWQRLSLRWRSLMAYVLTDQAYALAIIRYEQHEPSDPRGYYLGLSLVLWLTWQTTTIAGAVLGARLPESWSLDFAVPLIFLSLLAPVIRDRAGEARRHRPVSSPSSPWGCPSTWGSWSRRSAGSPSARWSRHGGRRDDTRAVGDVGGDRARHVRVAVVVRGALAALGDSRDR